MNETAKDREFYVYVHTAPNGKRYVGLTSQKPEIRWGSNGVKYKRNDHFYSAIKKYGWDNFKHEILFEGLTLDEAAEKEKELIKEYDCTNPKFGYNRTEGGETTVPTEHMRKIISRKMKGRKPAQHNIEGLMKEVFIYKIDEDKWLSFKCRKDGAAYLGIDGDKLSNRYIDVENAVYKHNFIIRSKIDENIKEKLKSFKTNASVGSIFLDKIDTSSCCSESEVNKNGTPIYVTDSRNGEMFFFNSYTLANRALKMKNLKFFIDKKKFGDYIIESKKIIRTEEELKEFQKDSLILFNLETREETRFPSKTELHAFIGDQRLSFKKYIESKRILKEKYLVLYEYDYIRPTEEEIAAIKKRSENSIKKVIIEIDSEGNIIKEYQSVGELCKLKGYDYTSLKRIFRSRDETEYHGCYYKLKK